MTAGHFAPPLWTPSEPQTSRIEPGRSEQPPRTQPAITVEHFDRLADIN